MISLYSNHGKHKRIGKFKSLWNMAEWCNKNNFSTKPDIGKYFYKTTIK